MTLVLGLTGPNASGKGEAATYLSRLGFRVHSLSDIVREEARAEGLPTERRYLIEVGNRLRREGGPGVLAERILERLGERDAVDSIRNPAEIEVLRRLPHFFLIGVSAPTEVRFKRSLSRARPGDPQTLSQFRRREAQENTDDPAAQQLDAALALADRRIVNHGDLEALHRALDRSITAFEADSGT